MPHNTEKYVFLLCLTVAGVCALPSAVLVTVHNLYAYVDDEKKISILKVENETKTSLVIIKSRYAKASTSTLGRRSLSLLLISRIELMGTRTRNNNRSHA